MKFSCPVICFAPLFLKMSIVKFINIMLWLTKPITFYHFTFLAEAQTISGTSTNNRKKNMNLCNYIDDDNIKVIKFNKKKIEYGQCQRYRYKYRKGKVLISYNPFMMCGLYENEKDAIDKGYQCPRRWKRKKIKIKFSQSDEDRQCWTKIYSDSGCLVKLSSCGVQSTFLSVVPRFLPKSLHTIATENPTSSPNRLPTSEPSASIKYCSCSTCSSTIWNTNANGPTCGERITWLQTKMEQTEESACRLVAGTEFPVECLGCDPDTCNDETGNPTHTPQSMTPTPPRESKSKCGGAVNSSSSSRAMCEDFLWQPTGDSSMHCFAYGGDGDPCHLNNNNDPDDGIKKNPLACVGDTFYLWDEPDTQGRSYAWAGAAWAQYALDFADELVIMRRAGTKVTSPLVTAGGQNIIKGHVDDFFDTCGSACRDPNDPAFIDIVAVNAFCGPWNGAPSYCREGAEFIVKEVKKVSISYNLPVYVTNWSRLQTLNTNDQLNAIDAIDVFFQPGSPIGRVYWFGATDFGGGSKNNLLTNTIEDGRTLGQVWKEKCTTLD